MRIKKEHFWAYIFITPMVVGTLIFGIIPIFYSFIISLTDWNGIGEMTIVGLENYKNLFTSETTLIELKNTLVFTAVSVPINMLLSTVIAVLLNQKIRGKGIYRVLYFLPNIVMATAATMIWKLLLNSKFGVVNIVLRFFHLPAPSWISDPKFLMASVIIVSVWSSIGYNSVILLAGLQGISSDIYEAARLDGSGPFTTFFKITMPLVSSTMFFILTMGVMNGLKAFDTIYAFTQNTAAPLKKAVRTMVYGIFDSAFTYMKLGPASAEAILLLIIIIIITAVQFKLEKKWVYYE